MSDTLVPALDQFFRGKARWHTTRSPLDRTFTIGFQCERLTPVLRVSESFLEDANSAYDVAQAVARQCLDLYEKHHRLIGAWKQEPILTCRECCAPVDLPREKKIDFEFCERQSVLWAERAIAMRR